MNHKFEPADKSNPSDDKSKDGEIVSSEPADNSNPSDDESKDGKIVLSIDPRFMIDRKQVIVGDYTKLQSADIVTDTPKRPTPIQVPIVTIARTNRLLSKSKSFLLHCYVVNFKYYN